MSVFRDLLMHYDKTSYYIKFSKKEINFIKTDGTKQSDTVEVQSNTNWKLS